MAGAVTTDELLTKIEVHEIKETIDQSMMTDIQKMLKRYEEERIARENMSGVE